MHFDDAATIGMIHYSRVADHRGLEAWLVSVTRSNFVTNVSGLSHELLLCEEAGVTVDMFGASSDAKNMSTIWPRDPAVAASATHNWLSVLTSDTTIGSIAKQAPQ